MIKNMKLGIQMLRHAYGLKSTTFMGIAFLILGTGAYALGENMKMAFLGEYMFMCVGMLPAQMLFSLSASNMIQASPVKKKMQTTVPALITWGCMMILYLVLTAVRAVMILNRPEEAGMAGFRCIVMAVMMMLLMVYIGVAYKYFLSSIVMILLAVLFLNSGEGILLQTKIFGAGSLGFIPAAGLGIVILAAGGLLQYLISLLFYKVPISKMAQAAPLRREL